MKTTAAPRRWSRRRRPLRPLRKDEAESNGAATKAEGNPLPGNLVTHLGPQNRFQVRGEIELADGTVLTLLTAEGSLEVDVSEADALSRPATRRSTSIGRRTSATGSS